MKKILCFIIVFLCIPMTSFAEVVKDLYQAEVPLTSTSEQQRQLAMNMALKRVLIKVSGNPAIATLPTISNNLSLSKDLVEEFSYQQRDSGRTLVVSFDRQGVNRLLSQSGQAIWTDNRTSILVWLAADSANGPTLIGSGSNNDLETLMDKFADDRGLPVIFPVLDLTDLNQLSVNDVWNLQLDKVLEASKRYATRSILLGQLSRLNDDTWSGKWEMMLEGENFTWETTGKNQSDNLSQIINDVTDALAARYAIFENVTDNNVIYLSVSAVKGVNSYAKVMHYLQSLSPVKNIEVTQVAGDEVKYTLTLTSNLQSLMQAIARGNTLKVASNDNTSVSDESLRYYLVN